MAKSRQLSVYEKNQLLKYSLKEEDLLSKGELPVEYLTGFVDFKDLLVKIDQNVLIPRVETEELVDLLIESSSSMKESISYLEIGTGSGAISLAFFDYLRKQAGIISESFVLTDLSDKALEVAEANFSRLFGEEASKSVKFLQNDLLNDFSPKQFNLIVANLPYIPSAKIITLDQSVKDYEPLLALDGGATGFELINKMLLQILEQNLLAVGGKIFLEVDETHSIEFIKSNFPKIEQEFFMVEIKDQFERQRFLILQKR